jgi:hypothetical protein
VIVNMHGRTTIKTQIFLINSLRQNKLFFLYLGNSDSAICYHCLSYTPLSPITMQLAWSRDDVTAQAPS